LADWLSHIAYHTTTSIDPSFLPSLHHPNLALFSPPPSPAQQANEKLAGGHEPPENLVERQVQPLLGFINSHPVGKWGVQGPCDVCRELT